jgi:hypothetical protein
MVFSIPRWMIVNDGGCFSPSVINAQQLSYRIRPKRWWQCNVAVNFTASQALTFPFDPERFVMADFDVAHLREQGQDMIIVPLKDEFQYKSDVDQHRVIAALQVCARAAGLAGTVVPVWDAGGGRMAFIAPRPWHPFFKSLRLQTVAQNINKRLTCSL